MKIYIFGNYMDFKCLAGNCQTTCCSGWKIVVDKEAYARFEKLEDEELRVDILLNIVEKDDVRSFKNMANGDCAMLDSDGLCRIQKNSDERTLCNTCRKYPRLSFSDKETMLLSMAASCPVVIDYLSRNKKKNIWYEMSQDKKLYPVMSKDIPKIADINSRFDELMENIRKKYYSDIRVQSQFFYDVADIALEIILSCNDCKYFDGSFDVYEQQLSEDEFLVKYNDYLKKYKKKIDIFERNYIDYRIVTQNYESKFQNIDDEICQVAGEIIMIEVIMFSLSQKKENKFDTDITETVHWVYKTAVHGKTSGDKMHKNIMKILEDVLKCNF